MKQNHIFTSYLDGKNRDLYCHLVMSPKIHNLLTPLNKSEHMEANNTILLCSNGIQYTIYFLKKNKG